MEMKIKFFKKVVSFIATFAVFLNSLFLPLTALAQEVSPTPASTDASLGGPEPTELPTESTTPTSTATPEPTPTIEAATPTPTESEQTPTAVPTIESPTPASTDASLGGQNPTASPEAEVQGATNENSLNLAPPTIETQVVDTSNPYLLTTEEQSWFNLITDKLDYAPTEAAVITGSNFIPNKTYSLTISSSDYPPTGTTVEVTTNGLGEFSYVYQLDGTYRPNYLVEVKENSVVIATTTFTDSPGDNPSATLSQYANDVPVGWVNGNLGASKATYYEGDSIPYRMVMDNLSLTSHSLTIEWDTTKSGKHAEDYLTSFDRTVTTANPCTDVVGCSTFTTFPIPVDPQVSGASVTQIAGDFKLYGGNITGVSVYSYDDGTGFIADKSARITITFTPNVSNPVLAWGGHIAHRNDWGIDNSAISISGSPYHMRLIDLDGSGGNQDRSLSADAVIFPATITVVKDAVPNSAQDFAFTTTGTEMSNFSLDDDADVTLDNVKSFTITSFVNNNGDVKTITEGVVAGWSLTGLVCDDDNGSVDLETRTATLSIVEGENVTCTFTNTLQNGTLRVNKVTTPAEAEVFSVTATGSGTITGSATQNVTGGAFVDYEVTTGTYSVTETPKTGWSETGNTCINVSVPAGGMGECTITNTKLGKIIVEKQTLPDNSSQSFEFDTNYDSNFFLTDGQSNDSGFVLLPRTYSVSEILPTGWDQDNATCSDNSNPASINLSAGEAVTCVFTNSQRGSISGYKYNDLNGDGVNDADWSPVSGWIIELWQGQTYITYATTNGSGFYSFTNLINGVYTLIEQMVSGWTNVTSSTLGVTLNAGENDQNNNFVNTQYGKIIVQKQTLPDGSRQSFEFDPSYGSNFFLSDGQSNDSGDLYPGSYSVAELTPNGWDLTGVTCSDGSAPTSVSISSGETVTCTFTNTQRGHVIIKKDAVPDSSQEFTFNNNFGNGNPSTFGLTDDSTAGLPSFGAEVLPGKYSVSEDDVAGWKTDSIVCDNGETYDDIDIAAGETVTCTFTNEKLASITLVKNTVGGNGNFDFDATGTGLPADIDLTTVAGTASQAFSNLDPDLTYTISENVPDGWTLTSAVCSGTNTPGSITPNAGEEITCTFTNSKLPTLTVVKVVVNDNGGTKVVSDFPLFVDQTQVVSGVTNTLSPDDYIVSETTDNNYSLVISGDCDENGNVSLSYGDNKTCTITNDDIAPSLTLIKSVVNDDGGQALASDWTLTATGPTGFSGNGPTVNNGVSFDSGTYDLSESSSVLGYEASSWVCDGGNQIDGDTIDLDLGESATCTITNDDIAPRLTVVKHVVGSDSLEASDFTMNVLGTDVSDTSFDGSETGTTVTLDAGSYVVSEDYVEGYTVEFSDDCQGTIANGEEKTCTITNTRNTGKITVVKLIDVDGNLQTDDRVLGVGWEMSVDGSSDDTSNPEPEDTDENGEAEFSDLKTGTYTVGEEIKDNYQLLDAYCDNESGSLDGNYLYSVDLGKDDAVICTFVNFLPDPEVTITKSNNNSEADNGETVGYTLNITNNGNVALSNVIVYDALPGGFTYVLGTSKVDGLGVSDPTQSGNTLEWNIGGLDTDETKTVTYDVIIDDSVTDGSYTNLATCTGSVLRQETSVDCNVADSSVSLGSSNSYGGSLFGQVLGASIELPATGNPTWLLAFALLGLTGGLILKKKYAK